MGWKTYTPALHIGERSRLKAGNTGTWETRRWELWVSSGALDPVFRRAVHVQPHWGGSQMWNWSGKYSNWSEQRWARLVSSIQFSCLVVSDSLWPHRLQHSRLACPSPSPRVYPTHVHRVSDAIQPSHPLSSPSSLAFSLSQHQGLFQ